MIYRKRKTNLFLIIAFLFFFTSWAKEKNTTQISIAEFIVGLNEITLPFSTEFLLEGKTVTNEYFYYEKGNDYYELEDLKCFGYFKKEKNIYLLYGFSLLGEGEGFATDMIILSSFYNTGKHIQDIELGGSNGGEGGAYIYEKAIVSAKDIIIDVRDEHYGVDTGLDYSVIVYKRNIYNFDEQYEFIEKTFKCDKVEDFQEYYLKLQKGYESKDSSIYGLSYMLENYMYCFPVAKNNIASYKHIWNFMKRSIEDKRIDVLLKEIKKHENIDNVFMVSVNNLRLRDGAELKANKIGLLPMHSEVVYLNEKSQYQQEVILNEGKVMDYWYKVKTTSGKVGWLHGCCVNPL